MVPEQLESSFFAPPNDQQQPNGSLFNEFDSIQTPPEEECADENDENVDPNCPISAKRPRLEDWREKSLTVDRTQERVDRDAEAQQRSLHEITVEMRADLESAWTAQRSAGVSCCPAMRIPVC